MNDAEKALCEAVSTYLTHKMELGVPEATTETNDHDLQFLHEHINTSFAMKIAGLTHYDSVKAAFAKVHNFKYVTDPAFTMVLEREMKSMAVPITEQKEALDAVSKIIKELADDDVLDEKDAGYHDDLNDVLDTSRDF